jgi:hypothetical protein
LALFALIDRRVSIERLPKSWDRLPTNDGAGNNTQERRHNWPLVTTGVSSVSLHVDQHTTYCTLICVIFSALNGMKQGDALSPLLLNFVLAYAIKEFQEN